MSTVAGTTAPGTSVAAGAAQPMPWPAARRVLLSCTVGTALEYYDFLLYGPIAALVFSKLFFPGEGELALLLSLGTFAAGFLARPIGAVLGGHAGDRFGRKAPMLASVVAMGFATFAIGCLPTYAHIGLWAPALLVSLRFVQGVALGAEWGGAALMAVEHAPPRQRAFYGSFIYTAAPIGTILSSGLVAVLVTTLSPQQMLDWGWRVPFLLSIVLVLFGVYLRLQVAESPEFLRMQACAGPVRRPVIEAWRCGRRQILVAAGVKVGDTANVFVLVIFVLGHATREVGISPQTVLAATIVASVVSMLAAPVVGRLCDRHGPAPVMVAGGVVLMAWAFPMFWLVDTGSTAMVFVVYIVGVLINCLIAAPMAAFYARLFEPCVRYSGMSLGYQAGTVLGGMAPLAAQALQNAAGGATWAVSTGLVALGVIVVACVALAEHGDTTETAEAAEVTVHGH